jgi:hypothetical protein
MMKEFLLRMPPEDEAPELEIRDYSDEKYEAKKLEMGSSKAPYERCECGIFNRHNGCQRATTRETKGKCLILAFSACIYFARGRTHPG